MKTKLNALRSCIAIVLLAAASIAGAQQVTIARDANLHAEPKSGAAVVGKLQQGAAAEQLDKQGAWVQLKSGSATGWTFSFNVNYAAGAAPTTAAPTQRRPTVSTAGIRGLEKEDLKNAQFDGNQLDALDSFASGSEAEKGKQPAKKR